MLLRIFCMLMLNAAPLLATNTAGEPTDIANWPPCAQKCIPQGYGPPADCENLANLTCICQQGTFSGQIAECERLGCSSEELKDISTLSNRLCAPVGGFGTSLLATLSAFVSSTQLSISTTPTIPPSITAVTQASSVLATATTAPDLGNPADIRTYPVCAQVCTSEAIVVGQRIDDPFGDVGDIRVACSARFRSATAGCETATCTPSEYQTTQLLAQQLCGSLYNNNAILGTSVSSAIASATAAAKAATQGKDPTNLANYPPCAQKCIPQNNFHGCGSITNLECVCQGVQFNDDINPCETSSCSQTDLQTIAFLAEKLCVPVGGVLTNPVNYTGSTSNLTSNSTPPAPFTGEGTKAQGTAIGFIISGIVAAVGVMLL